LSLVDISVRGAGGAVAIGGEDWLSSEGRDETKAYFWPGAGFAWRTRGMTILLDAGMLIGEGGAILPLPSLTVMARL
jgi:hypothetical protein